MSTRPVPQPTRRGVAVCVVLVGTLVVALVTGTPALVPMLVAASVPMLAAPPVAAARARRAARSVAVEAWPDPPVVAMGDPAVVCIRLTRPGGGTGPAVAVEPPGARWRRAGDPGRPLGGSFLAPRALRALPPAAVTRAPVPTGRRGVLELPASRTWVRDPFGLFAAAGPPLPAVRVAVHPVPAQGDGWPDSPGTGGDVPGDTGDVSGRGGLGDLVGIRPYQPGDRLSLLSWPARARLGSWFVKEFEAERGRARTLVLDDRAGVHRRRAFDTLLGHVLGLVDGALEEGDQVTLVTLSGEAWTFAPSPDGHQRARVVVAGLLPRPGATAVRPVVPAGAALLTTTTGAATVPDHAGRVLAAA